MKPKDSLNQNDLEELRIARDLSRQNLVPLKKIMLRKIENNKQ